MVGLVIGGFCVHGFLLLNDGIYWDGWLLFWLRKEGNFPELARWTSEAGGVPFPLLLRWVLGSLPDTALGFKIVAFASILVSAVFIHLTAYRFFRFSSWESLALSFLSLTYPAYQVAIEINIAKYLVTYALFLVGAYCGFKAECLTGRSHAAFRAASALCFALAFGTASLLVFYAGYLALWVRHIFSVREMTFAGLGAFLMRRADVLLLPVAYRFTVVHLFPVSGYYQDYNAMKFSWQLVRDGYQTFFGNSIAGQWGDSFARMGDQPWVAVGALLVIIVVFLRSSRIRFAPAPALQHGRAIVFALGLLALGMLPYVLVGKPAWRHGWSSRHALLVALPMALLVLSVVRALCAARPQVVHRLGFATLGACVWLFTISTWSYYVSWQARWVKDLSVVTQLRSAPAEVRGHSTFWIVDQYPVSPETHYEFYEWASMFKLAWGDESHIGIDLRTPRARDFLSEGKAYFGPRYQLSAFNPAGSQATLAIGPGPLARTEAGLVLGYWQACFLRPESLSAFLHGVVTVSVREGASTSP